MRLFRPGRARKLARAPCAPARVANPGVCFPYNLTYYGIITAQSLPLWLRGFGEGPLRMKPPICRQGAVNAWGPVPLELKSC